MNGEAGKGSAIRVRPNWEKFSENYDQIFKKKKREVTDGYSVWPLCEKENCGLHVVRPGKVQCDCDCEK